MLYDAWLAFRYHFEFDFDLYKIQGATTGNLSRFIEHIHYIST